MPEEEKEDNGVRWGVEALKEATGGSEPEPEKKDPDILPMQPAASPPGKEEPAAAEAPAVGAGTLISAEEDDDEQVSFVEKLSDAVARRLPWGKTRLCTGAALDESHMTAVLLSDTGGKMMLKDIARVEIKGGTYAIGLRSAVRALNKKWKLRSTENYIALSSSQITYKFFSLAGLSASQMHQAVIKQMGSDKRWDPNANYLSFAPVGSVGNQTRVFACYAPKDLVGSILEIFSSDKGQVYTVEPDVVSFHRSLLYSGMLRNRTLALIDVTAFGGQVSIFTGEGIMLSRALSGKKGGMGLDEEDEEKPEEEAGGASVESFDINIAVDEIKKTFNYYEYSLFAGEVDAIALTGEGVLLEPFRKRLEKDIGITTENVVIDIPLQEEMSSVFDPLSHGTSLGAVLSGVKWS